MKKVIRKILIQKIFKVNRNSLPSKSELIDPKIDYHPLADGIIWEDEEIRECSPDLENVFRFVINYRTYLIINNIQKGKLTGNVQFNKEIFELAKKYFPDWIGFDKGRCSYIPELSDKIKRIQKVSEHKINKLIDNDIQKNNSDH